MSNNWITHVKNYQAKPGCSYKQAMIDAKSSYKKTQKGAGGQYRIEDEVNVMTNRPKIDFAAIFVGYQRHPGGKSRALAGNTVNC